MESDGAISIWFFVGVSLVVNGALILGAGIYELSHPPAVKVVLYGLHADIWWGGLLAIVGGFYCAVHAPWGGHRR
ncbi:MAG TPA: hypothetical protein VMJ93_17585 [Verrucomicrobiae bacterium]|nr:hypothetical protein [Verrucomicrobiae bacterium]